MEYSLPTLVENLSENERTQPLNALDKGLRNQLIVDMLNSGILQFSQAAVDEIVREVNTKEKLDNTYKQIKELKEKLPKKVLPTGASLLVDVLPDGSLPILKTEKKELFANHSEKLTLPNGPDIDKDVKNISGSVVAANSFNRPGMITPRTLSSPRDFNDELLDMGVLSNTFEEQDQYIKYISWTTANYDSLRNFIKAYRKCKHPEEKKILVRAIKEIVRDINESKRVNYGDAFSSQNLLNRLVNCNIFLTVKEKETFQKWNVNERRDLESKITNHEFYKMAVDTVDGLESANDIRDYILRLNKSKEHEAHESILKDIQEGDVLKGPILRRSIKDMVHKLRVWGVIDNNAEACDKQYNKCMLWSPANVDVLASELNKISEGVLLFEELTKGQLEFLRAIINHYNDFPKSTDRVSPPAVKLNPFTGKPITGFTVLPAPATFKYNDQTNTSSPIGWGVVDPNYNSFLGTPANIDSKLSYNEDYIITKRNPEVKNEVKTKDFSDWKDIWSSSLWDSTSPINISTNISLIKKEDNQFVGEVKKAGVRVAATQLNKITKGILASAIPGDKSALLQQFLDSELGASFISMINGMVLTYGMKDNEKAQMMAKEFRISSLTTAGNFAVEEILELVSGVVADSLTENLSKSFQEIGNEEEIELGCEDFIEEKMLKI